MSRPAQSITILITSRDRARFLRRNFEALRAQRLPEGVDVEFLFIDNASEDETAEIVADEAGKGFPFTFRSMIEPVAGRAKALNTGLLESRGDLIFLIDDDAFANPDWLFETWKTFVEHDADIVGGKLVAPPGVTFPDWFRLPEMAGIVAVLDWGEEVIEFPGDLPYGANMALRRDVALEVGGYDERLGRTPTSLLAGEEFDLCRRILEIGGRGVYCPTSVCEHQVRAERLTPGYCRRWKWGASRSGFYAVHPATVRGLLGVPAFLVGDVGRRVSRLARVLFRGPKEERLLAELGVIGALSALYEAVIGWRKVGLEPRRLKPARPAITAIIPAHNAASTIVEAIRSVLDGDEPIEEVLVVNDRSTDDTASLAMAVDPRVRVIESAGPGPSAARNTALAAARTKWVGFLDADDVWLPHRISLQLDALARYPESRLVSSRIEFFDGEDKTWSWQPKAPVSGIAGFFLEDALSGLYLNTQTVLASRESLLAVGGFDESLHRSEDFDLWTRVIAKYPSMFVDAVVARKRVHGSGLSADHEGMFDALHGIVTRRLDESDWSSEVRRRTRRGFRRRFLELRGGTRLAAGDRKGAQRDAGELVGLSPLSLRAWKSLFKVLFSRGQGAASSA